MSPEFELDHLFVMTAAGAPATARLARLGFTEGSANVHPGQGTRNRRFFFERGMLELLWVHDAHEAREGRGRALALWQRWSQRGAPASPFGVCLRRAGARQSRPFNGWAYRPVYLPREWHILVGDQATDINQPLCFYLPFMPPFDSAPRDAQPRRHRNQARRITGVQVCGPQLHADACALSNLTRNCDIRFARGPEHCLEVELDAGFRRQHADLRPLLPLVLRW